MVTAETLASNFDSGQAADSSPFAAACCPMGTRRDWSRRQGAGLASV